MRRNSVFKPTLHFTQGSDHSWVMQAFEAWSYSAPAILVLRLSKSSGLLVWSPSAKSPAPPPPQRVGDSGQSAG